jgi:uncharacterized membrane protein
MSAPSRTASRRSRRSLPGNRESAGLLVSGAITALTLSLAFGLLALGVESFWMVFVVGFGVVLPTALGVVAHVWPEEGGSADSSPAGGDSRTPVEELKMRYARGELTDEEFERQLELVMERGDGN